MNKPPIPFPRIYSYPSLWGGLSVLHQICLEVTTPYLFLQQTSFRIFLKPFWIICNLLPRHKPTSATRSLNKHL